MPPHLRTPLTGRPSCFDVCCASQRAAVMKTTTSTATTTTTRHPLFQHAARFSPRFVGQIMSITAAVLHIGNIRFDSVEASSGETARFFSLFLSLLARNQSPGEVSCASGWTTPRVPALLRDYFVRLAQLIKWTRCCFFPVSLLTHCMHGGAQAAIPPDVMKSALDSSASLLGLPTAGLATVLTMVSRLPRR